MPGATTSSWTLTPGMGTVIRLLAFRNEGRMGDYREAMAIGTATGTVPTLAAEHGPDTPNTASASTWSSPSRTTGRPASSRDWAGPTARTQRGATRRSIAMRARGSR